MKIDLLKIIEDAKKIYYTRRTTIGMCCAIRLSMYRYDSLFCKLCLNTTYIENHINETIHKPPKHYYPLKARHIEPYWNGYWWKLTDVESRLKRFDEYIEYFKKPENRYLEV